MSATKIGRDFDRSEAVRFCDAMEKVCGMLGALTDVPDDLRAALLVAKREAYVARDEARHDRDCACFDCAMDRRP